MSPGAANKGAPRPTLAKLWKAAQRCTACDLYRNATQAVLGAGPATARLVMVGELELVHPQGIVCLGAVAAMGLLGPSFRITRDHGRFFPGALPGTQGAWVTATLHPSAILRMPDRARRHAAREECLADLAKVAARLAGAAA